MPRTSLKLTQSLANRLCDELMTGATLTAICKAAEFPDATTVNQWAHRDVEILADSSEPEDEEDWSSIDRAIIDAKHDARARLMDSALLRLSDGDKTQATKGGKRKAISATKSAETNENQKAVAHISIDSNKQGIEQEIGRISLDGVRLGVRFHSFYAQARELGYHRMSDELIDIADDSSNDVMLKEGRNGTISAIDHENINRSRLKVDTRKWLLSKALPKLYGPLLGGGDMDAGGLRLILTGSDVDV